MCALREKAKANFGYIYRYIEIDRFRPTCMEVGKEIPNLIRKHTQKSAKVGGGGRGVCALVSALSSFSLLLGYQILHKFSKGQKGTRTLKVEKRMLEN
jgi:hypothetical protein